MITIPEEWQDRFYGWKKRHYNPWRRRIKSTIWLVPEGDFRKELTFRLVLLTARKNYSLFNNIQSLDLSAKESIRLGVRRRIIEVANSIVSNWMAMLEDLNRLLILFILVVILGVAAAPTIYWSISITKDLSVIQWGLLILLHAFFFVSGLFLLFFPYLTPLKIKPTVWAMIMSIVYLGAVFILPKTQINFLLSSAIASGLIGVLIITLPIFFIIHAVVKTISRNMENTSTASFEAVMVFELIRTLSSIETTENGWSNVSFKNTIMFHLEKLATLSEQRLFSGLVPYDDVTNSWLKKTAQEIGAGFRNLKKPILSPKDDSREFIINHIKNDLLSAVNGYLDKFEKCTPETISFQQFRKEKIKPLLGDVLSGIIPLGLIWLLSQFGVLRNEITSDYLIVAAMGWITLSILSIFNPSINDAKLETLKSILSGFF